jgi:Tfp pilus assembly protein PilV
MNFSLTHNQKGFTLIETLFAVLIFSASLISLMVIAARGISATAGVEQETVAHYLAQEGVEVVRNTRDSNFLSATTWDTGFAPDCLAPAVCQVIYSQTSAPTLSTCVGIACTVQKSPIDGSFINSLGSGSIPSPFVREVSVVAVGTVEYQVSSQVKWTSKNIDRTVVLQTILKKWR